MLEPFDDPDLANQHQFDSVFTISKQKQIRLIYEGDCSSGCISRWERISDLNWFDINGPFFDSLIEVCVVFFCLISNEYHRINNLINRVVGDNNRADDNQYSINSISSSCCIYIEEISHITQEDTRYYILNSGGSHQAKTVCGINFRIIAEPITRRNKKRNSLISIVLE